MSTMDSAVSESRQLATFRIGEELFGLGINNIREIVRFPAITGVPRSPAYLTGLTNLRGNVLPVVDARLRLGVNVTPISDMTRVLVVETDGMTTGLVVDRVCGVISLESVSVETPPPLLTSGVDTRYVKSVLKADGGKKIIMEINAENLCLTDIAATTLAARQDKKRPVAVTEQAAGNELQLVTFLVAREEYAFPIESVREVLRIGAITEVPDEPPHILGILSVRNTLLPVVDVRRLLGLPSLVESLHAELGDLMAYVDHVGSAFNRHADTGTAWSPDATSTAVARWLDGLHSASDILGRHYQTLRGLFLRLLQTVRVDARSRNLPALLEEARPHVAALVEQLRLKVVECQKLLPEEIQEDQRILVIEIGVMPVGILVDRMNQVIRLPEKCIELPPPLLNTEKASSLRGIVKLNDGKRLIMLVDQDTLLNAPALMDLYRENCASGAISLDEIQNPTEMDATGDFIQLVTFRLGDEEYGISIDEVQEINRFEHITSVPRSPAFVEGVMNLRGNVIPAIDLRKRFGLGEITHDEATRVIIVTMNGKLTGLIVDAVSEVFRLQRSSIEDPPGVITTQNDMEFIKGICKASHTGEKMIVLLDVSKLLAQHEQMELKAVVAATAITDVPAHAAPGARAVPQPAAVPPAAVLPAAMLPHEEMAESPEQVIPEQVIPEPTLPESVLPGQAFSEPVLPEPVLPEPALPEPALPEPALPEPALPEPALPEPALPEPALPGPIAAEDPAPPVLVESPESDPAPHDRLPEHEALAAVEQPNGPAETSPLANGVLSGKKLKRAR